MFVIFLRFDVNRALAGQWMSEHKQWIQDGIADGTFLMAGSLHDGGGGVVIAAGQSSVEIHERVARDPFVMHGVVTAEIHAVTPSLMTDGLATLLQRGHTGQDAP
ncbi:MAG TPA: hypothetical protein VJ766_07460 [Pseudoxanthomonas sp.]|nr:hypothetical protein [Pseudoxanthomonas sp.]